MAESIIRQIKTPAQITSEITNAKAVLITRRKYYNIPANKNTVTISADSVSGYKFICWLSASSTGWVGSPYIEFPNSSTSNVWQSGSTSSSARQVCVHALYVKSTSQ